MSQVRVAPSGRGTTTTQRRALAAVLAFSLATSTGAAASSAAPGTPEDAENSVGDIELSLAQVVERALNDNPALIDARLRRQVERFDFAEAERRFLPKISFGTLGIERTSDLGEDTGFYRVEAGPGMMLRLPTGGIVDVNPGWSVFLDKSGQTLSDGAGVRLRLRQPLLRGGGLKVGTAPVRLARVAEAAYRLAFEAATMDVVTAVIYGYRAVIQAERRLAIDEDALERARASLAVNRALIDTGRMAETAIAETEAEIARRELALVRSLDSRDSSLRALNVLLDLDAGAHVIATESVTVDVIPPAPDPVALLASARAGNTSYRRAMLDVERVGIGVTLAENDMLWDVSLTADVELRRSRAPGTLGAQPVRDVTRPFTVGIALSIPVGGDDVTARRRARLAARTSAQRAEHALASSTRQMETDVNNGVRAVSVGLRQMELARRSLDLAAAKLEVEQQKLRLGRSTNFRVTQFEADFVQAQVSELDARIGYLNAVTALDRTVGGTLETWNIDIEAMQE